MIETERLFLRRWRETDREPLAALHADPLVMDWMGRGVMTQAQSDAQMDRFDAHIGTHGFGLLATARKLDRRFLGFVGLSVVNHAPPAPQGVELVWYLLPEAWGFGYATEAARAVMDDGFARLKLQEIIAYTAAKNVRSQSVMRRIGLIRRPDLDFEHPALAVDHPLRPHVVFSAARPTNITN